MNANELNEPKLTLPYTLGGKDDPHFQDHGGPYDGYWRPQDDPHIPDHGGNWTPDRIEANEEEYADGDPQEYGDGSPDYESLRDDGRSDGYGESYSERQ